MWLLLLLAAVRGSESGLQLDCTNDFLELMTCSFEAPNCAEHTVSVAGEDGPRWCRAGPCSPQRCCCSVQIMPVSGETHRASVLREGVELQSRVVAVTESIRPRPPENLTVDQSNGILRVQWKNEGKETFLRSLRARVRWRDVDSQWESELPNPSPVNGHFVAEIRAKDLKPRTRYWVTVRTVSNMSGLESRWSPEVQFTTAPPAAALLPWLLAPLSLGAVVAIAAAFWCYVRVKSRWWDSVPDYKSSRLLLLTTQAQQVLKPETPDIRILSVEPREPTPVWWDPDGVGPTSLPSCSSSGGGSVRSSTESVDVLAQVRVALSKDLGHLKAPGLVPDPCRDGSYGLATQGSGSPVMFENKTYCAHQPGFWGPSQQPGPGAGPSCQETGSAPETGSTPVGTEGVATCGPVSVPLAPAAEGYQTRADGPQVLTEAKPLPGPLLCLMRASEPPALLMVSGYKCVPTDP